MSSKYFDKISEFGFKSSSLSVLPRHVGVILDGNRRYTEKLGKSKLEGHRYGAEAVVELIKNSFEYGISELTLFAFSIENFKRSKIEIEYLMSLFMKYFTRLKSEIVKLDPESKEYELTELINFNFIGRLSTLPQNVQKSMSELMSHHSKTAKLTVNIAMGYGGRAEIVDACKKIVDLIQLGELNSNDINENEFAKYLYLSSDVDLIIRTSEERLSGFLSWQSTYAEIIFLPDLLWPEFDESTYLSCLYKYSDKKRRFGK